MEERATEKNIESIKKQAKQQFGLKNKLLFTIVSLISVVAILSVGVYATINSFAVKLDNSITVEVRNVSGALWVQRTGGILAEIDGEGNTKKSTKESVPAPKLETVLYDIDKGGIVAENLGNFVNTKVNLSREHNSLTYVFKYTAYTGTVKINVSPVVLGLDSDKIKVEQKFCYSAAQPNWEVLGHTFANSHDLTVSAGDQNTIFIYVNVSIATEGASYSISDASFNLDVVVESVTN